MSDRDKQTWQDTTLMACVRRRNQRCLEILYHRHYRLAFSMAKTVLNNKVLAEEVVQDIFLAIWEQPEKWDEQKGSFSSWLLTITRYTAIDRLRYENRRPPTLESPLDKLPHLLARDEPSFETKLDNAQLLRRLLDDLPTEQRQVILMAFFKGMTHPTIAQHLGIPLGTVKSRIRLGLQKLRENWQNEVSTIRLSSD